MKNFLMIGASGYIAPRHMKAIKDTGNNLIAALDKFDSVGVIDSYFPNADFFTEFERFDRHVEKLKRNGTIIDYVSIASPNYLHDAHIRFGLRHGADVICEKPLVLNPWNIDALLDIEKETGRKVNTILQLRLHENVIALKKKIDASPEGEVFDVDMTYITSRGNWYHTSWKGDETKSGGIATNIGVHFFDMLAWVFGNVEENYCHLREKDRAAGFIKYKKANVKWFLSINPDTLPAEALAEGKRTFRSTLINGEAFEFSDGFTELHSKSYQQILDGNGFPLEEARVAIQTVYEIRNAVIDLGKGVVHPFAI